MEFNHHNIKKELDKYNQTFYQPTNAKRDPKELEFEALELKKVGLLQAQRDTGWDLADVVTKIQALCEELWGHEFEPDNGYDCLHCGALHHDYFDSELY